MAILLNPNVEPAVNATVTVDNLPITVVFPSAQEVVINKDDDSITTFQGTSPWVVSGTVTANTGLSQPLTDAQLRATPVPISGTITATPSGTQDVNILSSVELEIKNDSGNPVPVSGTFFQATQPISGTVTANAGSGTFAISAAALPLPSGAATSALQTQPGVDIGDVTINNASGAGAVNIQDGGNSITVDGTVAATQSGTWNVGTVTTVTNVVHVDDNAGSLTVDNAGTFAVQATLAAETTKVIGTVNQGTSPWVTSGTSTVSGTVAATQSGTWTVQPGNTANTTAWKVDGSAVTQPVSGTITASPASGSLIDRSGNATNVSSQIMAANSSRKYLFIQNSAGVSLWINFGVAAVLAPPSIEIKPNGAFTMEGSFVSTQAVNIIKNAAASTAYTAKEG